MSSINWYKKYTPFQKWFFCVFIIGSIFSFFLPALTGASWVTVFTVNAIIGLLSSITGVLNSIYVCRAEIILYLYWAANTIFFGIQCLIEHLYATFFLNIIVVLPIIIIGYFVWVKAIKKSKESGELKDGETLTIKKFNKKQWIIAIIIFVIGWIAYGYFAFYFPQIMKHLFDMTVGKDTKFIADSFISVGTVFAVVLTSTRNVENWLFWLATNIVGTVLFIYSVVQSAISGKISVIEIAGSIMYIQYLTSSIYGYWCWMTLTKKQGKMKTINNDDI